MSSLISKPKGNKVSGLELPTVQSACNPRTPLSSALFRGKVQPALDIVRKNESNIRVPRVSRREQRYFYGANNAIAIQLEDIRAVRQHSEFSVSVSNRRRVGPSDDMSGITIRMMESTNQKLKKSGKIDSIKQKRCFLLMASIIALVIIATSIAVISVATTNNNTINQSTIATIASATMLLSTDDISTIGTSTSILITTAKETSASPTIFTSHMTTKSDSTTATTAVAATSSETTALSKAATTSVSITSLQMTTTSDSTTVPETTNMLNSTITSETKIASEYSPDEEETFNTLDFTSVTDITSSTISIINGVME